MQSAATTVGAYLSEMPDERRVAIVAVRDTVMAHLPDGLEEAMQWGMIVWHVPLSVSGPTYNGQPLAHTALANQKQYMSVYLTGLYGDDALAAQFEADYRATGKRYDVGKSCVRFRRLDDLPLELIGRAVAAVSVADLLAAHEGERSLRAAKKAR